MSPERAARGERKARTREAIVRSAERLLRASGVAGASVATVMAGAGLTVGGFYAHFASKEALIEEALATALGASRDELTAGGPPARGKGRLRAALKRYLSTQHRDHPEAGCPLPASLADLASEEGEPLRGVLVEQLERHVASLGTPRERQDVLGALALMVGGLSLARAVRGTPLSEEILRAARRFGEKAL